MVVLGPRLVRRSAGRPGKAVDGSAARFGVRLRRSRRPAGLTGFSSAGPIGHFGARVKFELERK